MTDTQSLYEKDYALWLDRTIADLKAKRLEAIDWQNLIEEVEDLSRRERQELKSRLTNLLEHIIKRSYISLPECYRGWVNTIVREQQEIESLLSDSPSLINIFNQIINACWSNARKRVLREYDEVDLPLEYPFPCDPDRLLNDTFWE